MNSRRTSKDEFKILIIAIALFASLGSIFLNNVNSTFTVEKTINATITNPDSTHFYLKLKTAKTPLEREQGLMFVIKMVDYNGMVFIFDKEGQYTFWMNNTFIPLDLIFLDKDNKVVHIYQNAVPFDSATKIAGPANTKYIIELPAGSINQYNIQVKTQIYF